MSYDRWEVEIAENIGKNLDCTFGEAQGILDAHDFELTQAWAGDLNPQEAAEMILKKAKVNS